LAQAILSQGQRVGRGKVALAAMVAKRKASAWLDEEAEEADSYSVDWWTECRRPFRRGFVPYGPGVAPVAEAVLRRKRLGLEIMREPTGEGMTPCPLDSFEEVGVLHPWLLEALRDDGCYEPTALQAQALPIVLAGQNLLAIAEAGMGQAATYLLAGSVHAADQAPLSEEDPGPIVLVLVATQELAERAVTEAESLLRHSDRCDRHPEGLRAVNVSGGGTRSGKLEQLGLQGPHFVVGTPQRVHDMASKGQLSLLRVTFLILEGADRMIELGCLAEVRDLASWVRPERQVALFATAWPPPREVENLAAELCDAGGQPVQFSASDGSSGNDETVIRRPGAAKGAGRTTIVGRSRGK